MMRGVIEMLPHVQDAHKATLAGKESGPTFELPTEDSLEMRDQGDHPPRAGESGEAGASGRDEGATGSQETRGTELSDEGSPSEAGDEGAMEAQEKPPLGADGDRHRDDTVEARSEAQAGLAKRLAMAREKIAASRGEGGMGLFAADMVAALKMQHASRGENATKSLLRDGTRGAGGGPGGDRGQERLGAGRSAGGRAGQGLRATDESEGDPRGARQTDEAQRLKSNRRKTAQGADRRVTGGQDRALRSQSSEALAAMERLSQANRARAAHLRTEIASARALKAASRSHSAGAADAAKGTQGPGNELASNVAREVRQAATSNEKRDVSLVTEAVAKGPSIVVPAGDGGVGSMMAQNAASTAAPGPVVETLSMEAQINEAVRTLNQKGENETILKLNDAHAGRIEVRLRHDGRDLHVTLRAEDVGGRQKMLEAMGEVRRELDKANLVAGRVDVSEFGDAGFDLQGQGKGQDSELTDEDLADGPKANEKSSPSKASPQPATTTGTETQNPSRDGRLHVVV